MGQPGQRPFIEGSCLVVEVLVKTAGDGVHALCGDWDVIAVNKTSVSTPPVSLAASLKKAYSRAVNDGTN